ncbi:MAG: hypothetical protein AAGL11_11580 [Pseudomonadota bacterium]
MRRALLILSLCTLVASCAIGQDLYDERSVDECRDLPTPNERIDCERSARDAASGLSLSQK